jgi:hypothetical protein
MNVKAAIASIFRKPTTEVNPSNEERQIDRNQRKIAAEIEGKKVGIRPDGTPTETAFHTTRGWMR